MNTKNNGRIAASIPCYNCSHKSCGLENRVWLHTSDGFRTEIALHPWCIHCGLVKNISDDKARKLGYWINILSIISERFSLKQVQKRIISKEIVAHQCFNDNYGITGSMQKELFKKIVKKYCNVDMHSIDSLIC